MCDLAGMPVDTIDSARRTRLIRDNTDVLDQLEKSEAMAAVAIRELTGADDMRRSEIRDLYDRTERLADALANLAVTFVQTRPWHKSQLIGSLSQ